MDSLSLATYSVMDLLVLHARIIEELRKRQILRTVNNPVADYAELLACRAFGLLPAANSEKGYDAKDEKGTRYQIKARRIANGSKPTRFGVIRKLEENHFDFLLAIVFTHDFKVEKAALLSPSVIKERAFFQEHVNGWVLRLCDALWSHTSVIDVTRQLQEAQENDYPPHREDFDEGRMQLQNAVEKRLPLIIDTRHGGSRVIAELFIVPQGIVFFDVGWCCDASWHPIHFVKGDIAGEGPWRVGDCTIREIYRSDPLWSSYEAWQQFMATEEGQRLGGREVAERDKDILLEQIEEQ